MRAYFSGRSKRWLPRSPKTRRLSILALVCAALALIFGLLQQARFDWVVEVEFFAEDLILREGRMASLDPRLAFVAIDRPSYASFFSDEEMTQDPALRMASESWPWSREVWSIVIERLIAAGARVVALDVVFPAEKPGDETLRATVDRHAGRIVLAADMLSSEQGSQLITNVLVPPSSILNSAAKHPLLDPRVGLITQDPDVPGNVIRRARFNSGMQMRILVGSDEPVESFGARMLRQGGLAERIPGSDKPQRFRYVSPSGSTIPRIPLQQILHTPSWKASWERRQFFKDKWVIVGPTAPIFHDEHRSPFGENIPGPEIHLNILNAALTNGFIQSASPFSNSLVGLGAGLLAWILGWRVPRLFHRFAFALLCLGVFGVAALVLYNSADLLISVFAPTMTFASSALFTLIWDYSLARREKAQLRRTLERYVAKDVVRELLDNPYSYLNSLVGVRKPVAILFSDVRGFTSMSEDADAPVLVKQLNEYFQEMVSIVSKNRGRLDKFIGDAVMADWGSFVTGGVVVDCERAVLSAIQMRAALPTLNQQWVSQGLKPLAIGIGVNLGDVIVGNLGSEEKMEVTVIGDAVNTASRLESLTKQYHVDLLLGESLAERVRDRFTLRSVDCVRIAGRSRAVEVFTIPVEAGDVRADLKWLASHERGIALYRGRQFAEAMEAFREAQAACPEDELIRIYLERCRYLLANPPAETWTGVFEMKSK